MAKANAQSFADFLQARAAAKDGYIMGSIGQDPKTLNEWYFSGQYSGDQLVKARYWREHAQRVWDCQGMSEGYLNDVLGTKIYVRARDNYATWCDPKGTGAIPAQYRVPGAAVFKHNGSYISHVGYLVRPVSPDNRAGDWYVVEAAGVLKGVITTRLNAGSWNRWGWMTKYFDYGTAPAVYELGDRVLGIGSMGDDVKAMQGALIALGYSCGKWGADGEFGAATQAALRAFQKDNRIDPDGTFGQPDLAALNAALPDEPEPGAQPAPAKPTAMVRIIGGDCHVRAFPMSAGASLGVAKRDTTHVYTGISTVSGWHLIEYAGEMGWVSGRYSEVVDS